MALAEHYARVRALTEALAAPLSAEDMQAQSMPDASPVKWHLAHTTWFFDTFVLDRPLREAWGVLFNSYYEAAGPRHPRPARGLLTRPSADEVRTYRREVDDAVLARLARGAVDEGRVELGLHHEQQHQELLLTDVHHLFAQSPLRPAYRAGDARRERRDAPPLRYVGFDGGTIAIGHDTGRGGFAFDNETPRHRVHIAPFAMASRDVTCGEVASFIDDGGYARADLWLSDGWRAVQERGWRAPLYWERRGGAWWEHTLDGMQPIDPAAPVSHVSYYEADAIARWSGARLPTEAEWEHAASRVVSLARPNLLDDPATSPLAPRGAPATDTIVQTFGDVWQWTASPYVPYPGFRPMAGALGEYNAKFMCNQIVLRGGSCLTPRDHVRPTYRNFFPPDARWQMTGLRLAKDA